MSIVSFLAGLTFVTRGHQLVLYAIKVSQSEVKLCGDEIMHSASSFDWFLLFISPQRPGVREGIN